MFAQTATDTGRRIDDRATAMVERNGRVGKRASAPAGAARYAMERQAGCVVDDRHAHGDFVRRNVRPQGIGRADRHAGHLGFPRTQRAGLRSGDDAGASDGVGHVGPDRLQGVDRADIDAMIAPDAAAEEICFRDGAGGAQQGRVFSGSPSTRPQDDAASGDPQGCQEIPPVHDPGPPLMTARRLGPASALIGAGRRHMAGSALRPLGQLRHRHMLHSRCVVDALFVARETVFSLP